VTVGAASPGVTHLQAYLRRPRRPARERVPAWPDSIVRGIPCRTPPAAGEQRTAMPRPAPGTGLAGVSGGFALPGPDVQRVSSARPCPGQHPEPGWRA
jgi:hypothetical protein